MCVYSEWQASQKELYILVEEGHEREAELQHMQSYSTQGLMGRRGVRGGSTGLPQDGHVRVEQHDGHCDKEQDFEYHTPVLLPGYHHELPDGTHCRRQVEGWLCEEEESTHIS